MPETLKREANPPSGQLAAPLPQAWDTVLKDFRKLTGELVQDSADPDARRFAMDVIPWSKTSGGVWVPGQVNAQLTGSSTPIPARTDLETIINAQSVAPGSDATAVVSVNGESEIWALVSIDRQPWSLMAGTAWYAPSAWGARSWYPERNNRTTTPSVNSPEISLYMPLSPATSALGLTAPQTLAEARQYLIPPRSFALAVRNNSGDVATVTVRLLRVWR